MIPNSSVIDLNHRSFQNSRAERRSVRGCRANGGAAVPAAAVCGSEPVLATARHCQPSPPARRGATHRRRMRGVFGSGGLRPRLLQVQPSLPPAPAARGEQPAQDLAQRLRASIRHIPAYGHSTFEVELTTESQRHREITKNQQHCSSLIVCSFLVISLCLCGSVASSSYVSGITRYE